MQSQQKRVKWSRGETAEALEERTDTGITQASVEFMENCIPDIYGNISRRPALKPIPYANTFFGATGVTKFGFTLTNLTKIIPFYITENDYILIGFHDSAAAEFIRIKDNICVYKLQYSATTLGSMGKIYSFAQQNNYLLVAGQWRTVKITIGLDNNSSYLFTPNVEFWEYTAGWYAPNGTQTKQVDSSTVANLNFTSNSIKNYVFTNPDGQTIVYSSIKTGISLVGLSDVWSGTTTTFYVHIDHSHGMGGHLYVNTVSSGAKASFTMTNGTTYNNNQVLLNFNFTSAVTTFKGKIKLGISYTQAYFYFTDIIPTTYDGRSYNVSSYFTTSVPELENYIDIGSIVQFPNNGAYMRVEGYDSDGTDLIMYGALMTPVADNNASDTSVNVEYGYISLTPKTFASGAGNNNIFPHPQQLCFHDQRLWAGQWKNYNTDTLLYEDYAMVFGSQIARYNDFKNDYNQENEPITLDILTQYKEKIVHLVDYNGLKIFTDSFEYAYTDGGVVKQSANGALASCTPIVFESLCLYIDSTGNQVRAMQYEFQSNIFNSSCINQVAPHDLIWYPVGMASYEDKVNSTGKYLFIANTKSGTTPDLAVCNFVPSNQANIWSRWSIPRLYDTAETTYDGLFNVIDLKGKILFMLKAYSNNGFVVIPSMLDFDGTADLEGVVESNGEFNIAKKTTYRLTLRNTPVAVYSNGVYQFSTTTNSTGYITDDLSGLTNITAGLIINSKIVSHPIDVGGKTKSVKKRIGKAQMSVHDTEAGAITINDKTGYMNPAQDHICFYGVSGMKDEIKYTITNKNGAMFHLESLLMNIEYGTLDS